MLNALLISQLVSWIVVLALAATVLALARQIGVLHERVAPLGALMTDHAPDVGDRARRFDLASIDGQKIHIGGERPGRKSQFLLFISPACPMCKKLLPTARSFAQREQRDIDFVLIGDGDKAEHEQMRREHALNAVPLVISPVVGMSYGIGKLPYAMLIDHEGVVRAKGLVNSREHLESLLAAHEQQVASLQEFLSRRGDASRARPNDEMVTKTGRRLACWATASIRSQSK
jgi:methylamine dehydrogenase accessory protein MauD